MIAWLAITGNLPCLKDQPGCRRPRAHGAAHPCRSRPEPQGSSSEAIARSREANTQASVPDDRQPGGRTRTGVYPRQGAMNIVF